MTRNRDVDRRGGDAYISPRPTSLNGARDALSSMMSDRGEQAPADINCLVTALPQGCITGMSGARMALKRIKDERCWASADWRKRFLAQPMTAS